MCSCHDLWFLLRLILDACVRIYMYLYKLFHFGHIWTLDISLLYNQNDKNIYTRLPCLLKLQNQNPIDSILSIHSVAVQAVIVTK